MLCLVGHHWLVDGAPSTYVRMEIEFALSLKHVAIIPVLLDDAKMPDGLPPSIGDFAKRHAQPIRAPNYRSQLQEHLVPRVKVAIEEAAQLRAAARVVREIIEGDTFRDDDLLPLMAAIPRGRFDRGSPEDERGAQPDEHPVKQVTIANAFAVSVFPVTAFEWNRACESGLNQRPVEVPNQNAIGEVVGEDEWENLTTWLEHYHEWSEFRLRLYPAVGIGWHDAQAYCAWASARSGRRYRLLSEAEWEWCCRAKTTTRFATGDTISFQQAHFNRRYKPRFDRRGSNPKAWPEDAARPVSASFKNQFGLVGMHGNVWEWVEDCYHENYIGAPGHHQPWTDAPRRDEKVVRGGCFASDYRRLRSASRGKSNVTPNHPERIGFRIACDL
jgi:formylglycine-generating enzyme required for sulfatase activity